MQRHREATHGAFILADFDGVLLVNRVSLYAVMGKLYDLFTLWLFFNRPLFFAPVVAYKKKHNSRSPYPKMTQKEVVEMVFKGYRMECPESCPKVRPSILHVAATLAIS